MTVYADRVKEITATEGTGSYALSGVQDGYQAFASAFAANDVVSYCVENGLDWEIASGTFNGTTGLTRASVLASSNGGAAVNWGAGYKSIFCVFPAAAINGLSPVNPADFATAAQGAKADAALPKAGGTMTGLLTLNPGARKFMSWTSIVGGEGEGVSFQSDTKFNIFIGLNSGDANVYAGTGGGKGSANTALGYQTLQKNTDGKYNVAIGTHALNANTTGDFNIGIGPNAGIVLADGWCNTAIGYNSLSACKSGLQNTAIGYRSLEACTASYNVAIGAASLYANVTGQYNFGLGYNTLSAQTAGDSNIAIGLGAGSTNVQSTSAQNFIIGTYADVSAPNASNEFVCGADLFKISNVYFGNGAAHASPAGYTIHGTGGSGSNVAGAALTLAGGIGTGTGAGGDIVFKTAKAGSTGSTPNTLAEAFRVSGTGPIAVLSGGGVTVANLPPGIQGAVAFVTDATQTMTSGIGAVVAGGGANKVPVFCDGTDWRIG